MAGSPYRHCAIRFLLGLALVVQAAAGASAADPGEHRQVIVAITSQLRGSISSLLVEPNSRPGGIAHLAPQLRRLRIAWPDLILVDAGNALTGAPDAPTALRHSLPSIAGPMAALGYDAVVLGERDLGRDLRVSAAVVGKSPFPWLAANVEAPALPLLAGFAVVERSGLRVGFIGLVSPSAPLGHEPDGGVPVLVRDIESVARKEAIRIREIGRADLVVAVGGGSAGDFDRETSLLLGMPLFHAAGRLADAVPELDLIVASRGRSPRKGEVARPNRSYRVPLVEPIGGSKALTVLKLDLIHAGGRWTIASLVQDTLWAEEKGDGQVLASVRGDLAAEKSRLAAATSAYVAARPSKRVFLACAAALGHAAALRIHPRTLPAPSVPLASATMGTEPALPPISLLPMMWNSPHWTKEDIGRAVIRRDVHRWIAQDDGLVLATLTGRQVALLLVPYVRQMHGWRAPPSQVLFPGGLEVGMLPKSSEALAPAFRENSVRLRDDGRYGVWMTRFHRFGGSGVAAKVLVQADQPYRLAPTSLRDAVTDLLSDRAQPLPPECQRFLSRSSPPQRVPRRIRDRAGLGARARVFEAPNGPSPAEAPFAQGEGRYSASERAPAHRFGSREVNTAHPIAHG